MTHDEREQLVINDLQEHYPDFAGPSLAWSKVPDGQDPPDLVSSGPGGPLGLELVEWLDGEQMTVAKYRESQRDQVHRVLATDWKSEYRPEHLSGAFLEIGNERIQRRDEEPLRKEFFACSAEVDKAWLTNPDRHGRAFELHEFSSYPLMQRYFRYVRYFGGQPHGLCWIHPCGGDGGAYSPTDAIDALTGGLDRKLVSYSSPERQGHLKAHALNELNLLVHGGFNAYAYNTPAAPFGLEEIAKRGAAFYAAHPQRQIFNHVWFFNSLDSAEELNELMGFTGVPRHFRFLAQLWPEFRIL
jgi:hypothetical protein